MNRTAPRRGGGTTADPAVRRILLAALAVLVLGAVYAVLSPGAYQDDDLDHHYMALRAWNEPGFLLNAWGMPALTALLMVPAKLFGFPGSEFTTVVLTALAGLFTGLAARALRMPHPWTAALLWIVQPLTLELSYSILAEPLAATLVAAVLWSWYTDRPGRALRVAGWLPLARIETAFVLALVGLAGWRRTTWRDRLLSAAPLAAWALLSWAVFGDPLSILGGSNKPLNSLGVLHYARNLIVLTGPVVLFLFLWGAGAALDRARSGRADGDPAPRFPLFAALLVPYQIGLLTLFAWDDMPVGRSIGFLRHALTVFPAVALVAAYGLSAWLRPGPGRSPVRWILVGALPVVTVLFQSHVLWAHSYVLEGRDERRWIAVALLAAAGAVFLLRGPARAARAWGRGVVLAGAAALTVWTTPPITLTVEQDAVRQAVEFLETYDLHRGTVLANHPWYFRFAGRDRWDEDRTPRVRRENLDAVPPGGVVMWESHYGPRLWGDVTYDDLDTDPRFRRVWAARGDYFRIAVFQRVP